MKKFCLSDAGRLAAALALLAIVGLPGRLSAVDPDLPFTSGSTGADGPLAFREIPVPGRTLTGLAYDPVRQETVMYGGTVNGGSLNDTWVWRGTDWIRLSPATVPIDRWGHRMVWDAARGEVVMFGGYHNPTGRLNDTWTWNGQNWTLKNPATSPTARDGFSMAYDATRQRVVIFGGNGGGDETWLWDGTNWTLANTPAKPPSSSSSGMAYDAARQEIVFFGNYGQTWIWNGTVWAQRGSLTTPSARSYPALDYDPVRQEVVMYGGGNTQETWTWNGQNWFFKTPTNSPRARSIHSVIWDGARQRLLMHGGDVPGVDGFDADTWLWNGTEWTFLSGKVQFFDMVNRPGGVWNFTTINVPPGVTIRFKKNAANTPVRWLATGDVTIHGTVDLNGDFGANTLPLGVLAAGGPGGYDGGRGGIRFDASGSFIGQPGQGPGGGAPGTAQQVNPENLRDGRDGLHNAAYGNVFLQPLTGGSGGGGGASADLWNGGNGGGGGGAILISSSRDIILNGGIRANGGYVEFSNASYGGRGSGGGILLRADRVGGSGYLEAFGGASTVPNGRIRVESYIRTLSNVGNPTTVLGLPRANGELNQGGTLTIASVDGVNVAQPPTGNLQAPDVVFTDAGPVNVIVNATGVPNGTPVTLRVTTANGIIQAPPQNLANGTVTFSVTVPKGVGTVQASAQYTQN